MRCGLPCNDFSDGEEDGSRVARMPTLAAKNAAKMGHPAFVLFFFQGFVIWILVGLL
jgi:hypothetical protein